MFRVEIVQPSIPHYRAPLFAEISKRIDGIVRLHAGPAERGGPPSAPITSGLQTVEHTTLSSFGGRVLWQTSLQLPAGFGSGDVLIVAGNPRYISNFPLVLQARRCGAGIIWWGHGWSPTSVWWRARLRQQLMRLADVVLLYADQEIEAFAGETARGRLFMATNNTVDPTRALNAHRQWTSERLADFAARNHLDGRQVALFCGRLRPATDLGTAVRALAYGKAQGCTPLLLVIGAGEEQAALMALADEVGVGSSLRWLGPIYEEEELAPWFLSSRCFVYPGSIGLSLLHAFTYGLPVITHDDVRLHNPEIHALRVGVNGRVFRRGDPRDLWQTMAAVLENSDTQRAMSEAARHTALVEWSFENMVQRFVTAISQARRISRFRQQVEMAQTAP